MVSAGIRKGACISMAMWMPLEFVAYVSGHDLRVLSALFEYLECLLAVLMPGNVLSHKLTCCLLLSNHRCRLALW